MRLIALNELTADDRAAWDSLAARAVEPNPFFEPLFVDAAAGALGAEGVGLLVDGGVEWSGCLPVQVRRIAGIAVLASSWRLPYTYLGTPLVDRDRVDAFAAALAASLRAGEHCRCLMLRRASDGPVLAALRARGAAAGVVPVFERRFERGAYDGRPADRALEWMKSKRRSELKRQRRKLAESLDAEVEVTTRADTTAAVADFLALESSGWKGEEGTAMAAGDGSARLFEAMCGAFADAGRLRISTLAAGGRPLAMTCDLRAGTTLFGFKSAYDEELRRFSPGVQLQVENFTRFDGEEGERLFDSCAEADNEMINGLWPDRRPLATVAFARRGPLGWVLGRGLEAAYERRAKPTPDDGDPPPSR
jgi:CelD/BcsL family acetyltransferase involved in cellulose biosynthesis